MFDSKQRLQIRLRFRDGEAFPASLVGDTVRMVEAAVYEEEKAELDRAREIGDLPALFVDAAETRLHRYRGVSVVFTSASSGSVILIGTVVGLALWLLNQTLGETLKEAWLASASHQAIKSYLLSPMEGKASRIVERIRRKKLKAGSFSGSIEANVVQEQGVDVIVVAIRPSLPEELRKDLQQP